SLTTGTSGLNANSQELNVVGDNIANANTIGYKASRAAFQDTLLSQVIGAPGGGQVGLGTSLQAIQRIISQGALATTGVATDLALQGNGFFVLRGGTGGGVGGSGQFYSRAGQFTIDNDGFMVSLDGLRLQGYTADDKGRLQGTLGDLQVGASNALAVATEDIDVRAKLDPLASIITFDPANPGNTSNFNTSVTIYDSLGQSHDVTVYYNRTGTGAWDWRAMVDDGAALTGGTAGAPAEIASGTMTFDTQGRLDALTQTSNFNPLNAVNPQPLTFNFGDPIAGGGTGLAGIVQNIGGNRNETTFVSQNGNAAGTLASIQINNQGQVVGSFTNGRTRVLAQVAVADFEAVDKLNRVGGNLLAESRASGQPTIGAPGEGGRATITSGALEQSNVDLANEFVRMIAAQRGFQANSKTITTADQLLGELMQLKR
ncbi:MAG: flagellar hook protein FlgE, partial [Myxococcaceae bacterium]|nr:flagellar hook protein FlgE [Myxococcaceae bacterium]